MSLPLVTETAPDTSPVPLSLLPISAIDPLPPAVREIVPKLDTVMVLADGVPEGLPISATDPSSFAKRLMPSRRRDVDDAAGLAGERFEVSDERLCARRISVRIGECLKRDVTGRGDADRGCGFAAAADARVAFAACSQRESATNVH